MVETHDEHSSPIKTPKQLITVLALSLGLIAAYLLSARVSRLSRWLDPLFMLPLATSAVTLGFGFIISSTAKSESTIPPFANLFTMPQFLLGGTFFSIDVFPGWLQKICEILPLKQLNDAMRNVAFEGAHLTDCGKQLGLVQIRMVLDLISDDRLRRHPDRLGERGNREI